MNDNNDLWNHLTMRGNERGADAVLNAAKAAAQTPAHVATIASAGVAATSDDAIVPAIELTPRGPRTKTARTRRGFGALGLAALLGVGGFATLAIQGNGGGADTPAGAVAQLADAINHEDLLAAVDIMAPAEVRTLHGTVDAAQRKAADEELVKTASKPLAGLQLDVQNLKTAVQTVGNGFAKVTIAGQIHAKTNSADFGRMLAKASHGHNTSGEVDIADIHIADVDPFLMVVKDGDGWYVSPAYTGLEYARLSQQLPAADFGSANAATLGADSPQAAATELVRAASARDWTKVAALVEPNEFPMYDYRAAFTKLMNDNVHGTFSIADINATADVHGTEADVFVSGGGTTDSGEKWGLADNCIKAGRSSDSAILFGGCTASPDEFVPLIGIFIARAPLGIEAASADGIGNRTALHATERSGRWYLSPMGTVLDGFDSWIQHLDHNAIAALFNQPLEITTSGAMTLNHAVDITKGSNTRRYTLNVDKLEHVVLRTTPDYLYPDIVGPDGQPVSQTFDATASEPTYDLQPNIEYSVVIRGGIYASVAGSANVANLSVTVWRASDAPPAPTGTGFGTSSGGPSPEVCTRRGNTEVCSSTGAATNNGSNRSTATSVASSTHP